MTTTLIAEIGTTMTRLALVDLVDGAFRLIARAETPSTLAAPSADATHAIVELAAVIASVTGRELVKDGRLLLDGDDTGTGTIDLAVSTSAAGLLPVVITALATQQSTREALHATHGSYATVQHVFSLGEGGLADETWLGRQIALVGKTRPDVILIAGGLEGGAVSAVERLAHVVALLVSTMKPKPHVIYAGNSAAADTVRAALGESVELQVVENLRPTV